MSIMYPAPPPSSSPEVNRLYDEARAMEKAAAATSYEILSGMLWGLGIAVAILFVSVLIGLNIPSSKETVARIERAKAENARHAAFMRECVPTEREARCEELWRWTKR